jgi:pimeloyl-ACP methyl ester carboxylesterase
MYSGVLPVAINAFKIAAAALLGIPLIVVAGAAYNYFSTRNALARSPVPGEFFTIGGRVMHLYCTGTGRPTVVVESGLGDSWIAWQLVQPEIAKFTNICTYDRAGLGWSDPDTGHRNAIVIAGQLHALLWKAGVAFPIVLIGHSAGGLYVREYVAKYPLEIAGIVLVDATPPQSFKRIPSSRETAKSREQRHREAEIAKFADAIGASRLMGNCIGHLPARLGMYRTYADAAACRPIYETSWLGEADDFEDSASEVKSVTFGDTPLLVISQDPDRPKPNWNAQSIVANPIWAEMQESSKSLSRRSWRLVAKGSGHHVQIDRPDVVIEGVREMILALRGERAPPYGTTEAR